jgi:hypothetical protein
MKKQSLLLMTGGILAFASCNTDNAGTVDNSQAKIDSMVNERVEMIRAELEAKNDSIINERAIYMADSMMAVASGKPAPARRPSSSPAAPTTTPTEEPKKSRLEEAADQNKKSTTERLKEKSDQNKQSTSDRLKSKADQNK